MSNYGLHFKNPEGETVLSSEFQSLVYAGRTKNCINLGAVNSFPGGNAVAISAMTQYKYYFQCKGVPTIFINPKVMKLGVANYGTATTPVYLAADDYIGSASENYYPYIYSVMSLVEASTDNWEVTLMVKLQVDYINTRLQYTTPPAPWLYFFTSADNMQNNRDWFRARDTNSYDAAGIYGLNVKDASSKTVYDSRMRMLQLDGVSTFNNTSFITNLGSSDISYATGYNDKNLKYSALDRMYTYGTSMKLNNVFGNKVLSLTDITRISVPIYDHYNQADPIRRRTVERYYRVFGADGFVKNTNLVKAYTNVMNDGIQRALKSNKAYLNNVLIHCPTIIQRYMKMTNHGEKTSCDVLGSMGLTKCEKLHTTAVWTALLKSGVGLSYISMVREPMILKYHSDFTLTPKAYDAVCSASTADIPYKLTQQTYRYDGKDYTINNTNYKVPYDIDTEYNNNTNIGILVKPILGLIPYMFGYAFKQESDGGGWFNGGANSSFITSDPFPPSTINVQNATMLITDARLYSPILDNVVNFGTTSVDFTVETI